MIYSYSCSNGRLLTAGSMGTRIFKTSDAEAAGCCFALSNLSPLSTDSVTNCDSTRLQLFRCKLTNRRIHSSFKTEKHSLISSKNPQTLDSSVCYIKTLTAAKIMPINP
jgi:hypothetical protein